jgi:hypothetical protein
MPLSATSLTAIARSGGHISVDAYLLGADLGQVLRVWAREGGSITIRNAGVLSDSVIRDIARDFTTRVQFEF